jgi:formylglycine-generating enzyme required for sulfatase activity
MRTSLWIALIILLLLIFSTQYDKILSEDEVISTSCRELTSSLIFVKGGSFDMGASGLYPEEFPVQRTVVEDFWISRAEVTNREFAVFVEATGYITVAERQPNQKEYPNINPMLLTPGSAVFVTPNEAIVAGTPFNWWHFIEGANWKQPQGVGSHIQGKQHYPVVHIAFEDAQEYAKWKGHRLPTEAEFEYAARGGLENKVYAWGDKPLVNEEHQANTWQGVFPFVDSAKDGFQGLAPVACFAENGYGVNDMIGNVWEWTSSYYYPSHVDDEAAFNRYSSEDGFDPRQPTVPVKVVKGGSYLCSPDFCVRYRPAARQAQETGLGSSHIGFRTVKSVDI